MLAPGRARCGTRQTEAVSAEHLRVEQAPTTPKRGRRRSVRGRQRDAPWTAAWTPLPCAPRSWPAPQPRRHRPRRCCRRQFGWRERPSRTTSAAGQTARGQERTDEARAMRGLVDRNSRSKHDSAIWSSCARDRAQRFQTLLRAQRERPGVDRRSSVISIARCRPLFASRALRVSSVVSLLAHRHAWIGY